MKRVRRGLTCGALILLTACTSGIKDREAASSASPPSSNTTSEETSDTQVPAVPKPTDPNDTRAWAAYLGEIVRRNLPDIKRDHLYPYLVPAGNSEDASGLRQRQLEFVHGIVARGVPPGMTMVFAGPDSGKTAEFVTEAFKDAKQDSFKDVIVLVIGDAADKNRVTGALQRAGATVRYENM